MESRRYREAQPLHGLRSRRLRPRHRAGWTCYGNSVLRRGVERCRERETASRPRRKEVVQYGQIPYKSEMRVKMIAVVKAVRGGDLGL